MMNGGPYREPRLADRRATSRPESTHRQAEDSQPVRDEPKQAPRTTTPRYVAPEEKTWKRFLWPLVGGVVAIVIAVAGWLVWSNSQTAVAGIDTSRYQAVFFTNGQVYFGKLQGASGDSLKLTDIYYLQSQQPQSTDGEGSNPQETGSEQDGSFQLVKLGEEIHGPEDEMIIFKDQVLFYENLKDDGRVSQSIKQHKGTN